MTNLETPDPRTHDRADDLIALNALHVRAEQSRNLTIDALVRMLLDLEAGS